MADSNTDVLIYIERVVDRIGDASYEPTAHYAKPSFYAYVANFTNDVPSEFELRLSGKRSDVDDNIMVTITPRQLNEEGDLYFPLAALEAAIHNIQVRTEENERARQSFHAEVITADQEREEDGASADR